MNREQVIKFATEAGFRDRADGWFDAGFHEEKFERFAVLVAAAARKACAKVCEEHWKCGGNSMECADAIRSRGKE